MSRRKTIINPIRTKRINELIQKENISQKKLADLINHTQQSVNRICNGHNALTEDTAKAIINAFPNSGYRLEWLLGYDNDMTKADFWRNGVRSEKAAQDAVLILLSDAFKEISQYERNNTITEPSEIPQEELKTIETQLRDFAKSLAWNYLHQSNSHFWRHEKLIDERIMEKESEGEYYG